MSGIVGNDWFDFGEHKHVTSVSDGETKLLGGPGTGSSPQRLMVSTVGDELKMSDGRRSRVIGISLKDRAAILPAGHMANGAYWFDAKSGNFVSSTYYFADLPGWVKDFNARAAGRQVSRFHVAESQAARGVRGTLRTALETSPFGNELVELFAERALAAEQLGKRDVTDVLTVSFSSNDYVGHGYGTYSPEEHAVTLETDELLGTAVPGHRPAGGAQQYAGGADRRSRRGALGRGSMRPTTCREDGCPATRSRCSAGGARSKYGRGTGFWQAWTLPST